MCWRGGGGGERRSRDMRGESERACRSCGKRAKCHQESVCGICVQKSLCSESSLYRARDLSKS